MGIFDFLNNNPEDKDYKEFSEWLNRILIGKIPDDINGFNFNLYEGSKNTYDIQLIGTNEYNSKDEDWACSDYFSTNENICYLKRRKEILKWDDGLNYIRKLILKYLETENNAKVLKQAKVIGMGFVDGDNEIIYRNQKAKK